MLVLFPDGGTPNPITYFNEPRAIIGITAATGDKNWQSHDILSWDFKSLYLDPAYNPPILINGA